MLKEKKLFLLKERKKLSATFETNFAYLSPIEKSFFKDMEFAKFKEFCKNLCKNAFACE